MMIPAAKVVTHLTAESKEAYSDRSLYAVEGMDGLYRRVRRTARGLKQSEAGNVVAHLDSEVVELRRWPALDIALSAHGYRLVGPASEEECIVAPVEATP